MRGFLLGLLGGGIAGGVLWFIARQRIEAQFVEGSQRLAVQVTGGGVQLRQQLERGQAELTAQISSQVPPTVERTIRNTLSTYGITPEMGRRFATIVAYAQAHGWV